MSQYPPQYPYDPNYGTAPGAPLPYGQASYPAAGANARPTSVTVLAIIGIIIGSLLVLCDLFGLVGQSMSGTAAARSPMAAVQNDPVIHQWNLVSAVVHLVLGILLLYGSIASLSLKPPGRTCMIAYAVPQIIMLLIGAVITLTVSLPHIDEIANSRSDPGFQTGVRAGFWGAFLLSLALIVWPILILYFMSRPHVKAAFERR